MFTGQTKNLAVMGWPVAHSLSPAMQNAAIEQAGLDYAYIALPVQPSELSAAVAGLRAMNFCGWNVTIPHKTAIMPLLDDIDPDAAAIGAVNTVVNDGGRLIGYNTDVIGFLAPLNKRRISLAGANAVLLGAGGAARAIIRGLIVAGVKNLTIAVRNVAKAEPLAKEFAAQCEKTTLKTVDQLGEEYRAALRNADLIVNATPLGMSPAVDAMPPVDWSLVPPDAIAYDIIYTPAETKFLRTAKEHGHEILSGEEMLVGQGAAALARWTGIAPDETAMLAALRKALAK